MKNNKTTILLLIILAAACVAIGFMWANGRADKQLVEQMEEVNREKLDNLENQLAAKDTRLRDLEEKINGFQEELKGLQDDLKLIEEDNEDMKEQLRTAPPEHLIMEARRIVETEEIWLVNSNIKFSLSAFRDNTIILAEWENFSLKRIPNLTQTIFTQTKTIETQFMAISIWKTKELLWKEHDETLERINESWKDFIKKQQRKSIFDTILKVGAGIGLGFLIGSVISN